MCVRVRDSLKNCTPAGAHTSIFSGVVRLSRAFMSSSSRANSKIPRFSFILCQEIHTHTHTQAHARAHKHIPAIRIGRHRSFHALKSCMHAQTSKIGNTNTCKSIVMMTDTITKTRTRIPTYRCMEIRTHTCEICRHLSNESKR